MSERQEGWYWVKAGQEFPWEVDEWSHDNWVSGAVLGTKSPTIGPRIPSPDEPWVTVPVEQSEVMVTVGVVKQRFCPAAHFVYAAMIAATPKP